MIEKMKFLSIIGPKEDLDRAVSQYLCRYEIQLENSLAELRNLKNITPCADNNPYRDSRAKAEEAAALLAKTAGTGRKMEAGEAQAIIQEAEAVINEAKEKRNQLEEIRKKKQELLEAIVPYQNLHYDVSRILHFKHIKYRFGKIPTVYYSKLKEYLMDDICSIFEKCAANEEYVWGIYFVPALEAEKVDAVYTSLHFERFRMADEYEGTLDEAYQQLTRELQELDEAMKLEETALREELKRREDDILDARDALGAAAEYFDVRRLAAFTKAKDTTFFILCGWMSAHDCDRLQAELESDPVIYSVVEDKPDGRFNKPPTKLKNPRLFRPFEMFIRMYGLPEYDEFDPTIFVALTYSFIFGAMFGDVGQGLCLLIGGGLLYKFKKLSLAAIIACCGFFSTIFGFLFGSVFGFEDWIDAVWLRPAEQMTNLPFIGNLNTVFVVAIALGMGLVLLTMVFHIVNAFRQKDLENALFDTNGIAGLVFYAAVVITVVLFMTGQKLPAGIVLAVMFGLPLLAIALKEPLGALVEKKAEVMPKEKGMFVVQTFFELFEVLLSYFSNTLSFVRIGAFAVSHAAMMQVVMMLAGAENGGTPNLIVVIVGNLIVCGMEGLIVGIQVLRLEYYEFFSRFYKGGGREFKPYAQVK